MKRSDKADKCSSLGGMSYVDTLPTLFLAAFFAKNLPPAPQKWGGGAVKEANRPCLLPLLGGDKISATIR